MTELTELEKAVAMDTALYNEIESLLPKDGVIDDTCSLINELMYLIKRREMSRQSPRERALERAAIDFIHKVDRGEAKSTKSYQAFKAALAVMEDTNGNQ